MGSQHHVEKILGKIADGDVTVACWEPGQISPYHCHPDATEIYFCFSGGGTMRTPKETIAVTPGAFVVHPPGEVHEYENGAGPHHAVSRALRHRHASRIIAPGAATRSGSNPREDAEYYRRHPVADHIFRQPLGVAAQYLRLVLVGQRDAFHPFDAPAGSSRTASRPRTGCGRRPSPSRSTAAPDWRRSRWW